jgi:hypothetical protein
MPKITEAYIDLVLRKERELDMRLKRVEQRMGQWSRKTTKHTKKVETGFDRVAKSARRIASTAIKTGILALGAAMTAVAVKASKMAIAAEESANLFRVAMDDMGGAAEEWAKRYAKATRQSTFEIKEYLSKLFLMIQGMGVAKEQAFEMSKRMVELTVDMSSLRNLRIEDAFTKITAGLSGEMEPLKRLGLIVSEATSKQTALRLGLVKQGEEMDAATKVVARYHRLLEITTKDQGDMIRTLDSTENVIKQSAAAWRDLMRAWGDSINTGVAVDALLAGFGTSLREIADNAERAANAITVMNKSTMNIDEMAARAIADPAFRAELERKSKETGAAKSGQSVLTRVPPPAIALGYGTPIYPKTIVPAPPEEGPTPFAITARRILKRAAEMEKQNAEAEALRRRNLSRPIPSRQMMFGMGVGEIAGPAGVNPRVAREGARQYLSEVAKGMKDLSKEAAIEWVKVYAEQRGAVDAKLRSAKAGVREEYIQAFGRTLGNKGQEKFARLKEARSALRDVQFLQRQQGGELTAQQRYVGAKAAKTVSVLGGEFFGKAGAAAMMRPQLTQGEVAVNQLKEQMKQTTLAEITNKHLEKMANKNTDNGEAGFVA